MRRFPTIGKLFFSETLFKVKAFHLGRIYRLKICR